MNITSFTDQWGTVVAKYTYDLWGNPLTITDGLGTDVSNNPAHRANTNPIRYAGYRYDTESSLYYLKGACLSIILRLQIRYDSCYRCYDFSE